MLKKIEKKETIKQEYQERLFGRIPSQTVKGFYLSNNFKLLEYSLN
jgi:hypothetical protein